MTGSRGAEEQLAPLRGIKVIEFTHMVMNDYVPTFDEWMKLFKDSNWECAESHPIGIPHSCIFDLRVK